MLTKPLLACVTILASGLLSVEANFVREPKGVEAIHKRESQYAPTNYALFDPYDDAIQPKLECKEATANTRRCGLDRHSLWTCKKGDDGNTFWWEVDTKTDADGNDCSNKCCRTNDTDEDRLKKCTRGKVSFNGLDYCWQILKPAMIAE